ncbi:MAG: sodium:proton exchanger [Spirochaetae bacterium HGW-Spirochaetae-5]|nr:MAG: sodium:proton exchanger [Spirochaetae bacterium HGW-Spirochaetae-5]
MLNILLLVVGFIILVYGATILVDGASSLAKKYNIPGIVIGLTIVAFGTSAPEFVVNLAGSFKGNSGIVLGNILGSNIFNILFILGISSIIYPLTVKSNTTWMEVPLSFISSLLVLVFASDMIIDNRTHNELSRIDGIVLIFFFVIFLAYNFNLMKKGSSDEEIDIKDYSKIKSAFMIIAGVALLGTGGNLIVNSAVRVAEMLGISERVIGLTIVSIGTSLPELATSVVAAMKRNVDIAVGNIVGSNIFNVFWILGVSAVVNPVIVREGSALDMSVNIGASLLLFLFIFTGKERRIDRIEGVLFLMLYTIYMGAVLFFM